MKGLLAFSRTSNDSSFVTLLSQRNVKQIPSDRILTSSIILLPQILQPNENLRNTISTYFEAQKLGLVALPYTSMFTLSNTAVTRWVCFPSPVLMSSITVKQKLGVVALPYTLMFMFLLLLIGSLVLVLV